MGNIIPDRFYKAVEVAKIIGLAPRTVYNIADVGDITHYKFKGSIRFLGRDIIEYIQKNIVTKLT